MLKNLLACGIAAVALIAGPSANALSLTGATVKIDQLNPTTSTVVEFPAGTPLSSGPVVVGAGIEYVANPFGPIMSFDIGVDTITVTALTDTVFGTPLSGGSFNGFGVTDLGGTIPDFSAFEIVSNTFGPATLSFAPNQLFINFATAGAFVTGNQLVASISVVPLPATLPLLLAALGGIALVARRRRTAAA